MHVAKPTTKGCHYNPTVSMIKYLTQLTNAA